MRVLAIPSALALAVGCGQDPAPVPIGPTAGTPAGQTTPTGGTTLPSTGTPAGTTTTPEFTFDCDTPLIAPPAAYTAISGYSEAEDFDFHPDGWVGIVYQSNLVGKDKYGATLMISPNVSGNAASTRVLSTGDWIIADNSAGQFVRVDHATGAKTSLVSGMSWPNGIEVGANDIIYATDFSTGRVITFDAWNPSPVTEIDTGLAQANGIGLSPDEQTLYVILSWTAKVIAYDRLPGGGWSGPRDVLYEPGADYQGLVVDYCGNIYVTDAYPGQHSYIIRISDDEQQVDRLVTLPSGYVPNAHFGHDIGGWNRMMLYASDREDGRLFEIDVGVPGKQHVAIP